MSRRDDDVDRLRERSAATEAIPVPEQVVGLSSTELAAAPIALGDVERFGEVRRHRVGDHGSGRVGERPDCELDVLRHRVARVPGIIVGEPRDPQARHDDVGDGSERYRDHSGIDAVEPGDHLQSEREVVDVARERSDLGATVVERADVGSARYSRRGPPTAWTPRPTPRRRSPDAATTVAADTERRRTRGDQRRLAAAAPARATR